MPKIIQIINTRRDALLALDDSGQLFAYCPEIAGLSVESWQRIPLLPEHMIPTPTPNPVISNPPSTTVSPRPIHPDWTIWLSHIKRKTDWFVTCPVCRDNIQSTDTAMLRHHWDAGHFDCKPEAPEGYEGLTGK